MLGVNIQKYDLRLVKESGNRYKFKNKVVKTPEKAYQIFVETLELNIRTEEVFAILTLDLKSHLTGVFEVSKGGLKSSIVHPRNVYQRAILTNAAAIVMGHNHPSGKPDPSEDDIKITKQIISAGEILGIEVMDHLIIGANYNYISMKAQEVI